MSERARETTNQSRNMYYDGRVVSLFVYQKRKKKKYPSTHASIEISKKKTLILLTLVLPVGLL